MKNKNKAGLLFGYIMTVALCVVFALFASSRTGWFLVIAFISAPLISVIICLIFTKMIKIEMSCDASAISKGDSANVNILIQNKFFLPSPFVEIKLNESIRLNSKVDKFEISVMPLQETEITAKVTAAFSGRAKIEIEQVCVRDFLGLFSFKIQNPDFRNLNISIGIIPNIGQIGANDDIILQTVQSSQDFEDSEETTEKSSFSFNGVPGYDMREYIPGDPVKKINQKLSAKRGKLYVRLDDSIASGKIIVVLLNSLQPSKLPQFENTAKNKQKNILNKNIFKNDEKWETMADNENKKNKFIAETWEITLENSLGIAKRLLLAGYSLQFVFEDDDRWQNFEILDLKDISALARLLSKSDVKISDEIKYPNDILENSKIRTAVAVTPSDNGNIADVFENKGIKAAIKATV